MTADARVAELWQKNRGGDVSSRDIEWLLREVERLRSLERRVNDVKAALEGKTIVDATFLRRVL